MAYVPAGEYEPPIWIQRQLFDSMEWFDYQLWGFERRGEDYKVAASGYGTSLTFDQAESLVGCPIDLARGEQFVPLSEPAPRWRTRVWPTGSTR